MPPKTEPILIVTDRKLFPPRGGDQMRIIQLIRSLRSMGRPVVLLSPPQDSWLDRFQARRLADRLVIVNGPEFKDGSPSRLDVASYADAVARAALRFEPAAVIAEYLWMAPCLDAAPRGTLRCIDAHDVMHRRREIFHPEGLGAWVDCSREEEAGLLDKADVVMAIQKNEQRVFQDMLPGKKVICVPYTPPVRSSLDEAPLRHDRIAFVGGINLGNREGLRKFIRDSWPLVRRLRPEAELRIYGDVNRHPLEAAEGVRGAGYVGDAAKIYSEARVVINPVTLGTGLKIKSVEALAYGKALVTTTNGAGGLEEGAGRAFIVEDHPARFAESVAGLLGDDAKRRELEMAALKFARENLSPGTALSGFLELLPGRSTRGWR